MFHNFHIIKFNRKILHIKLIKNNLKLYLKIKNCYYFEIILLTHLKNINN